MIGQTISHYQVKEQIGAGGMGVVYRAHDERLERDVALKVLSPALVDDQEFLARFRREARILSKLNHPNIATVHDFDSVDGTSFLVMEFIKGETLDHKLKTGSLPESEVLRLGKQLLEGLQAAHSEGIIHRDLKPGNLREAPGGLLKILDFGLARIVKDDIAATVTNMGSDGVAGTLPYMSPEQLQGESLDARTDIYSSGVVLYELATGQRPFSHAMASRVIDGILNKKPIAPRELNPNISQQLEAVILVALQKEPQRRYSSAREMREALNLTGDIAGPLPDLDQTTMRPASLQQAQKAQKSRYGAESKRTIRSAAWIAALVLGVAAIAATLGSLRKPQPLPKTLRPTVAILGFKNQTGNAESQWVSTSLSDMLASELAAGDKVAPISGESVTRMKMNLAMPNEASYALDTIKNVRKSLHCDYVVYGSYFDTGKAAGGRVTLDLRLQRTEDGEILATFNETGTELAIPELASSVGSRLRSKLGLPGVSVSQASELRAAVPSTPEASRFYYRGLEQLRTFDLLGSKDSFTKAIGLDPNFSLAHTYLAEAWEALGYDDKAKQESKIAFDLSSQLGREDRTVIEARFRAILGEWDAAVNLYRSLYTLYPENPEYAYRTTDAQIRGGKPDDALKTIVDLRKQPESITMDARLDLKEAEAAESLSDFAKEKAAASRASDDARSKGYRLLEAEALWRECAAMASLGEAQGAQAACRGSIALAQPVGDLLLVARGFTILGRIAEAQGDPAQGLQDHLHALEFARKIGSRRDITGALINIANAMASQGDLSGAQKSYQEALGVARDINDRNQIVTLLNNMATISQTQGDYPAALRLYRQSLDEARAILDKDSMARAQNNIGAIYLMQGNFAIASQNIEQAVQLASDTGHKNDQAQFLYALGESKLLQGDLAAAESNFQAGLKLASQAGDKATIALGQMSMADLKLQSSTMAEVEPLARPAADEFHAEGMKDEESAARNLLAAAFIALARPSEAGKELELIRGLSSQDPAVKLAVAITAGRLQAARTSGSSGLKAFEDLAEQGKKLGLPELQFEVRLAQAEATLLRGDRQNGLSLLSALQKDADRKGFRQFGARARDLAKQTAGPKPT